MQASEFKLALDYFLEAMKSVLFDFEIVNITEMPYIDVFSENLSGAAAKEE